MNHIVYPQITTFLLRAVPIFAAIFFGRGLVDWLLNNVPDVVTDIISVLGGVLPALGIAMLMGIVIKEKAHLVFFFAGFVLMAFANLNMIALVFLAAMVAYIVYLSTGKSTMTQTASEVQGTNVAYEDDDLF